MHVIYHGKQMSIQEITASKDSIYCILEKGTNSSKLRYCVLEKQNNKLIFKSIISDEVYDETAVNNNSIIVYQVIDKNKLGYINNNISIDEDEIHNLNTLFINTYKEYE